ncbi:unnamed protein product [Lymnaea stagnalis]|uniref:Rho-GAP domain-containing protein n=1 Tax=Lymnaea stagnalis TaxID=6523 RepID=A0AAV2HXB1_LYMST
MQKLTSQDCTQVTYAHTWKPKHLLDVALFGNRGHGMLTRLKCCLLPPSQQLMPVRHYVYPIPDQLEPWTHGEEKYGITFTSYLSQQHVEMLRIIAEPEFSLFYSRYYGKQVRHLVVENQGRGYPEKISEDKLFGLPLDLLMKKDTAINKNVPHLNIPSLLCVMLKFIHKNGLATKGIFKAPDSSTKVKKLKEDIEANFYKTKNYEISNEYNAHDVAAALKDFIAQLQKPLLTTPVLQVFPDLFRREKPLIKMIEGLNYYIMMMIPEHRDSLQLFLQVLHALTQNSAVNGLTVQDCGDIFWPVLFTLPPGCTEEEAAKRKKQFVDLTRVLVHYNEYLFTGRVQICDTIYTITRASK